nr:Glutamine amidotransferase class-I [Moritella viscosa]SHN98426.1 Glutamine amidotransferase class-I [Moritella viscosa]SHO00293.1 Glutamine amidotransferase class-I [Moritella viscosa]
MLDAGVARHSLPERDLLIKGDKVSIVDFERVTLGVCLGHQCGFFLKK